MPFCKGVPEPRPEKWSWENHVHIFIKSILQMEEDVRVQVVLLVEVAT